MHQTTIPLIRLGILSETFDLSKAPIPEDCRLVEAEGVGYMIALNNPGSDDPMPGSVELRGDDLVYTIYQGVTGSTDLKAALVTIWSGKGVEITFVEVKTP